MLFLPESFFSAINHVTLKVTNGCNLKCSYCNVEVEPVSAPRMPMLVFKRAADLLIQNSRYSHVGLEFHGGEPLLLEDEWFGEAVEYARALACQHGKTVEYSMQTNATMLTEARQKFLLDLGIAIGLSFDGPPPVNDRLRMAGASVERTIKRLVAGNQRFGMILVLSRANYRHMYEVMEYFRQLGVPEFRVSPLAPQGWEMKHALFTGDQQFEGMKGVFDHMSDTNCSVIEVDIMQAVNRIMEGRLLRPPLSCWERECQAGRSYCALNHRGEVFACGTDMSKHRLGHIDEDFKRSHVNDTVGRLQTKDAWFARCTDCGAKRICHYGCPTSAFNDPTSRDAMCRYTKLMYVYMVERLDGVERIHDALHFKLPGPSYR